MWGPKLSCDPALPLGCGKHLPINIWPSCSGSSLFNSENQSNPPPIVSGTLCRSDLGGGGEESKAWDRIFLCSGTGSTAHLSPHSVHTMLLPHCCFMLCYTLAWVFYLWQSLIRTSWSMRCEWPGIWLWITIKFQVMTTPKIPVC